MEKHSNEFSMLYKLNKEINVGLKSKFVKTRQSKKKTPRYEFITTIFFNYSNLIGHIQLLYRNFTEVLHVT